MTVLIRELEKEDFCRIEREARAMHALRGIDPCMDRLFGAFVGSRLVGMVRVKQMAEGYTVDRVSLVEECRRLRLKRRLMEHLIAVLGDRLLWIAAGKDLVILCWTMGFRPVTERALPSGMKKLLACPKPRNTCEYVPMVRLPKEAHAMKMGLRDPLPEDTVESPSRPFLIRRIHLD